MFDLKTQISPIYAPLRQERADHFKGGVETMAGGGGEGKRGDAI